MKKIFLIILLCLSMVACAGVPVDKRPAGCEKSVIYDKFDQPAIMGGLMQLAVYELAKRKHWAPEILAALDKHELILSNPQVSYATFAAGILTDIKAVNEQAGVELLIVSTMLQELLNINLNIDNCDREWFLNQIAQTRIWVRMAEAEG